MERIQDFEGFQYAFTTDSNGREEYDRHNVEYATSSYKVDHNMYPGLIVYPKNDDDVKRAVRWAKKLHIPIAVMSGGHQYSGACSTNNKGIQINLQTTYTNEDDLKVLKQPKAPYENETWVLASVSTSLLAFNQFLKSKKLFVPHGQCSGVHLGGHAQTGGYGQLGRSFGLLGDHIRGIRLIDHEGEERNATKDSHPELFNAILGGSPGNFGIITHYSIYAHRDADHDFPDSNARPHGFKGAWLYSKSTVKLLLNEIAAMAADTEIARNYDLCVSVLSSSFPMFKLMPELEENVSEVLGRLTQLLSHGAEQKWPASIVLYAQWVPMSAEDKYTDKVDAWFQKFRNLNSFWHHWCIHAADIVEPMSEMTGEWIFDRAREFDHPYEKRCWLTNSTTLAKDGWVDKVAERIDQVLVPWHDYALWQSCYLSVQIQCFGGTNSQYYTNRNNGTSYSWRDSTVVQTLDCFHLDNDKAKALAQTFQTENDKIMCGPNSPFSKQDKRVLWASWGDWDMSKSWSFYYEDRAKYEAIGKQRQLADPNGTFTANPFNVERL